MVDQTPDGIPFDLLVTAKTRITSGEHAVTLGKLKRRGDVAKSIHINR